MDLASQKEMALPLVVLTHDTFWARLVSYLQSENSTS